MKNDNIRLKSFRRGKWKLLGEGNLKQIVLFLLITLMGCKNPKQGIEKEVFSPKLIGIFVENIENSINWYTKNLGFEIEKEIQAYPDYGLKLAFLKVDDFQLEIIEKTPSYKQSEVSSNPEVSLGGLFKMGLVVNDLQSKYAQLKQSEEVVFVAELGLLPKNSMPIKWPTQHFLIQDPDGNYVQIFDSGDSEEVAPWLFMITVEDLEKTVSWYSENLGFTHHQTIGKVGNRRAVLERNNYVLELFEPEKVIIADKISTDSTLLGFKKIAFGVRDLNALSSELEKRRVEVVLPLEKSDFDWAEKAMIAKDIEGNWTQLFETKENTPN